MVLYANVALHGAVLGMQNALGALVRVGRMDEDGVIVASFAARQRLVQKSYYDELEHRYVRGPVRRFTSSCLCIGRVRHDGASEIIV